MLSLYLDSKWPELDKASLEATPARNSDSRARTTDTAAVDTVSLSAWAWGLPLASGLVLVNRVGIWPRQSFSR